jgi:hypothetical protein
MTSMFHVESKAPLDTPSSRPSRRPGGETLANLPSPILHPSPPPEVTDGQVRGADEGGGGDLAPLGPMRGSWEDSVL